jgi:uncharacterized membrane protein
VGPDLIPLLRWLHIGGATVLLGTGAGITFFMVMAHRTRDARVVAHTASAVILAEWIFTASAVVLQPITGALLARATGWSATEGWIRLALALYVFAGVFWIPVFWMLYRMRGLAREAARTGEPLPAAYHRSYWAWFICGLPVFLSALAILWLMAAKPSIALG